MKGALNPPVFGIPVVGIPAFRIPVQCSESPALESWAVGSLSRRESQCGFYLRNPCFRNSHCRNPCFRNSHRRNFSRIQAPLNQTPLRLSPRQQKNSSFLRGGGIGGSEENRPETLFFFLVENAMPIKF